MTKVTKSAVLLMLDSDQIKSFDFYLGTRSIELILPLSPVPLMTKVVAQPRYICIYPISSPFHKTCVLVLAHKIKIYVAVALPSLKNHMVFGIYMNC